MNTLGVGAGVNGTTIKAVLAGDGGIVRERADPAPIPHTGVEDVARVAASMARPPLALAGPETTPGVYVPRIVDEERGVSVFSTDPGWHHAPLHDLITHPCGCPVAFGHDVCSGALAKAHQGMGVPGCLYVAVGVRIASGLVFGDHLSPSRPQTSKTGQVGVAYLVAGVTVPLESVSSASTITGKATDAGIVPEGAGARGVEDVAVMGSREAVRILGEAIGALGHVLFAVAHQVGSISIVLGGGLSHGRKLIYRSLHRTLTLGSIVTPPPTLLRARPGAGSQALDTIALSLELEEVYA